MVSVEVDLSKLTKEINRFPRELAESRDEALRGLGGDIVTALRRSVKQSPAGGAGAGRRTKPHNSRSQAAQGVDARVKSGKLEIKSDSSRMAQEHRGFPAFWGLSSWSHPVYGNRSNRVRQRGNPGWFGDTVRSFSPRAERDLTDAGQRAFDTIKGER